VLIYIYNGTWFSYVNALCANWIGPIFSYGIFTQAKILYCREPKYPYFSGCADLHDIIWSWITHENECYLEKGSL
jgi:hypothetical protein